jgi:hypothetical protein
MNQIAKWCVLLMGCALAPWSQAADTNPQAQLQRWQAQAQSPASAGRGQVFFTTKRQHDWSCATCHNAPPTTPGKHVKTLKIIRPMAPSSNDQAFTSQRKVDKWFRRNCNDVVGRECTAQEKADVLAYLLSVR